MIQLGGAIHQPYLVLLGVEAQRFEVRSHMDGSTFFYYLSSLFPSRNNQTVAPATYKGIIT